MDAIGAASHGATARALDADEEWRTVYDFWFPSGLEQASLEEHHRMVGWWFQGGANAELAPFAPLIEAAADGRLNHWASEPVGRLSLIIVLDQFPRGLFAGTQKAFAFDRQALAFTEEGLRNGHYDALQRPWEKAFFSLPLIHAEGPDHLERADRLVALCEKRLTEPPFHLRSLRLFGLSQAQGHREVIARFGRHPHRNEVLGRVSTPGEEVYLRRGDFVHKRRPPRPNQS